MAVAVPCGREQAEINISLCVQTQTERGNRELNFGEFYNLCASVYSNKSIGALRSTCVFGFTS